VFFVLIFSFICFAQEKEPEFTLDVSAQTVPLPKIFKPSVDLSGRGFNRALSWPQALAAKEVLERWEKEVGFQGIYRLQYNLWEINEFAKDKNLQSQLLNNYEEIIQKITEAGGVVILDIFGTPAGLGKVLDKKSAPVDLKAFKELVKGYIRNLSCNKRYNIWYEVWSTPDSDDFFIGREQEYLNMYRAIAEGIKELEAETKVYIPLGGPAVSWWFMNLERNTSATPGRSLIYDLIKFCCRYKLPLDFITWHAYSSDPEADKEITVYKKPYIELIRDWLSYFHFDRNTPLIIDEWNFDRQANVLPERSEKSHICASYVLARLKNMWEAGLDAQLYFCLEDFQTNKEGIVRNVGIFWFGKETTSYEGGPKSIYNTFRMLNNLGPEMYVIPKLNDAFIGIIATKAQDSYTILVYNYIDPEIVRSYLSRNIAGLKEGERKVILSLIKTNRLEKIMNRQLDIAKLRANNRIKSLLRKALELNEQALKFMNSSRTIRLSIKNLKENYLFQRYTVDANCSQNCEFVPAAEKEIGTSEPYQETLVLDPYSLNLVVLKKKPPQAESINLEAGETKKATEPLTEPTPDKTPETQSETKK